MDFIIPGEMEEHLGRCVSTHDQKGSPCSFIGTRGRKCQSQVQFSLGMEASKNSDVKVEVDESTIRIATNQRSWQLPKVFSGLVDVPVIFRDGVSPRKVEEQHPHTSLHTQYKTPCC